MKKADIGLIGLAVMGENLVMNMESRGFTVVVYNRTAEKIKNFVEGRARGKNIIGAQSIVELIAALSSPRKVMLMVKAGSAVDSLLELLLPLLEAGDIIIDGGNSRYSDTIRRCAYVESKGLLYVGMGVSGGEEGALRGPSLMPGGSPSAWPLVKPIFQAIAAKANGCACCGWVGENGAGHFVKMVHNGIEYGDMQLICEAYDLMRTLFRLNEDDAADIFEKWNKTELESYLIEITRNILRFKDSDGTPLVVRILDAAGQKGTGKWATVAALDEGVPLTLIGEAVFARSLSAMKEERLNASAAFAREEKALGTRCASLLLEDLWGALLAAKIVSYAQGYMLMRSAAKKYGWNLNYGGIAQIWSGGCIIRSGFLGKIKEAFDAEPELTNLLLSPYFKEKVRSLLLSWRRTVSAGVLCGVPLPAFTSALSWFDGYTSASSPANLLQAQRDYFGAHTYERVDRPRGEFFHTDWTGEGGSTAAGSYNA